MAPRQLRGVAPIVPAPQTVGRAGSLLAAAYTPTDPVTRVDVPYGYRATASGGWRLLSGCSVAADAVDEHYVDDPGSVVTTWPYVIDVAETASTFEVAADDLQTRATARLDGIESAAIAHELWTGTFADLADHDESPRFAAGAAVKVLAANPVKGKTAQGLLEQALAAHTGSPGGGCIHIAPVGLPFLTAPTRSGDLLTTLLDNRVVADPGYPGTGPDGAQPAAGTTWVYATARPLVRRGATSVDTGRTVDRATNTLTYRAQRAALAVFAGPVYAVRLIIEES